MTESLKLETHLEFSLHVLEIDPVALPRGPLSAPRAEASVALLFVREKTPDPLSRWLAADPDPVTFAVAASGSRASRNSCVPYPPKIQVAYYCTYSSTLLLP